MKFNIVQSNSGMWHIYDANDKHLKVTVTKWGAKFWCRRYARTSEPFYRHDHIKSFVYNVPVQHQ